MIVNRHKVDYLRGMLEKFYMYPSCALWRGIELNLLSKLDHHQNSTILDLGCGDGYFTLLLFKDKNLKIKAGIDISKKYIHRAEKLNVRRQIYKTLEVANAHNLPYKEKSFSTVFSNCSIEHVLDLEKALREVYRVLEDNGRFIFTVPSPFFGKYSYIYSFFEKKKLFKIATSYVNYVNSKLAHHNCFDPNIWKERLKSAEFELVEYRYYITAEVSKVFDILELMFTCGIWKFRLNALLMKSSLVLEWLGIRCHKRILIKVWYDFLRRYINVENKSNKDVGAAILLIAHKKSPQVLDRRDLI